MGVNKVEYGGNILIDLTNDTITESDVPTGKTFHSADGEQKTGSVTEYTENKTFGASELYRSNLVIMSNTTPILVMKYLFDSDVFVRNGININLFSRLDSFGDATAEDVVKGKTFTSAAGFKEIGTHVCSGSSTSLNLQSKSVMPSESIQTVTADSGYDGLSEVSVGAISSTYVGSGIAKKDAATYTPGNEAQTISAGQYLEGDQTISAVPTETLEVTENGTYIPTSGKFINSVTVNVPSSGEGGSGGLPDTIIAGDTPILANWSGSKITNTSATATNLEIAIPKSGTYRFKIPAAINSTYATGNPSVYIYKNGVSVQTLSVSSSLVGPLSADIECSEGDVIKVYAAAIKSSYMTVSVTVFALIACIDK